MSDDTLRSLNCSSRMVSADEAFGAIFRRDVRHSKDHAVFLFP